MTTANQTPPAAIVQQASELAYQDDADQIVGQDDSGVWVIRHTEDPTASALRNAVTVTSGGIDGVAEIA